MAEGGNTSKDNVCILVLYISLVSNFLDGVEYLYEYFVCQEYLTYLLLFGEQNEQKNER